MPNVKAPTLSSYVSEIFQASGVSEEVAQIVADSLVLANLKGHDSHGVIRVLEYVLWVQKGWIDPAAKLEILRETDSLLLIDGHWQFGQVMGREATSLAIEKAKESGVCILSLRCSGHLGRLGEFAEMAAEEGIVCFSFTNTHGAGVLVAPHGGKERRLSANPLGAAAPLPDGGMVMMDFATSVIAEGKIKVARAKGEQLPAGCFVNSLGQPSTDPEEYYADPPGALLPFGGHKGFALALFADILAGGLSGAGCSKEGVERVGNSMLAVFLCPGAFAGEEFFNQEVGALVEHVKACPTRPGFEEILLPGDPELRSEIQRGREGIDIDEVTWSKIADVARERSVPVPQVNS